MNQRKNNRTDLAGDATRKPVSLRELILLNTDGGADTVRFLTEMMNGEIAGSKPTERFRAAKELLDRCYGKPTAGIQTPPPDETDAGLGEATAILEARINAVLAGATNAADNDNDDDSDDESRNGDR